MAGTSHALALVPSPGSLVQYPGFYPPPPNSYAFQPQVASGLWWSSLMRAAAPSITDTTGKRQ